MVSKRTKNQNQNQNRNRKYVIISVLLNSNLDPKVKGTYKLLFVANKLSYVVREYVRRYMAHNSLDKSLLQHIIAEVPVDIDINDIENITRIVTTNSEKFRKNYIKFKFELSLSLASDGYYEIQVAGKFGIKKKLIDDIMNEIMSIKIYTEYQKINDTPVFLLFPEDSCLTHFYGTPCDDSVYERKCSFIKNILLDSVKSD